jgi:protein O-GlcNAc transferase
MTVDELFQQAAQLHQAGRVAEAVDTYGKGLALQPDSADAHYHLGIALADLQRPGESLAEFREAVKYNPALADAHRRIGLLALQFGHTDEAEAASRRALDLNPNLAEARNALGSVLSKNGRLREAAEQYLHALRINPRYDKAFYNLGIVQKKMGREAEAETSFRKALLLRPDHLKACYNLAHILADAGRWGEAADFLQRALAIKPDFAEALNNLGNAQRYLGRLDEAHEALRRALAINPDYAEACNTLGSALLLMGRQDESVKMHRRAIELSPNDAKAHSSLFFALCNHPGFDAATISQEARQWDQRHAQPLRHLIQPHKNDRDRSRRLRIGYVSGDFRNHSVSRFFLPLLENHDRDKFEIFCFSNSAIADKVTETIRAYSKQILDIHRQTDESTAELIRGHNIDILVDLSGHSAQNRLLVFARHPAPVQITYLGFLATTGLSTMDYRFTDPHLDPPGTNDAYYAEKSIRLRQTYWCYPLEEPASPIAPPPGLSACRVTFGCLNNFFKVSPDALDLWIELLRQVPGSGLLLHAYEGEHRHRTREIVRQQGIDPMRLEFVGKVQLSDYFKLYDQIDVALDPFPYVGGTTTCDALWMGVPVVTLAGRQAIGRGGVSLLTNVGLPELIARNKEEYVSIAVGLAKDVSRLAELRGTLRQRMKASPLMDAPGFAKDVEAAYRDVWGRYCAGV